MSRIPALDPALATDAVRALLDGVKKGLGRVPNMFRVAAHSPASLEALVAMFGAVAKTGLDARAREAVALAVSERNGCDYCLSAHTALAKGAGLSDEAIARARRAESDDARLAAALTLARAIVERRGRVSDADLAAARRAGLTDADLVDVVTNVALTTFTNALNEVAKTEIDFPRVEHEAR